jgi:hypothetical protein
VAGAGAAAPAEAAASSPEYSKKIEGVTPREA